MALDLLFGVLEVLDFGVKAAAKRARTRNEATKAWNRAAEELAITREDDPQNEDWQLIVPNVEGFRVTVDSVGGVDGHTRVRAASTAPNHERLRIYAADSWSKLARAVGMQDVLLNDKTFDDRYLVKGNDPEFTRMWVNSTVRERIARVPEYRFELKNRRVTAIRQGLEVSPRQLVRAVRAVAACAHGRQRILDRWSKLKRRYNGKLRKEPDRWASLRGTHDGVAFTLDTYEHADVHFTTVTARAEKGLLPPFIVAHERHNVSTTLPRLVQLEDGSSYRWFSEELDRARAMLGEKPLATLSELGVSKVKVDPEQVTVFRPGICVSQKKLTGMIALACRLTNADEVGPYRRGARPPA